MMQIHGKGGSRWLTPDAKAAEMRFWKGAQIKRAFLTSPPRGGTGHADPEIYELCDVLNAMDGLCTLQSCAGHHLQAADGTGWCRHSAQLWLWLSVPVTVAFAQRVDRLALSPLVERVQTMYLPTNEGVIREVVDVRFRGMEHSALEFAQSCTLVHECFREVVDAAIAEGGTAWH